MARRVEVDGVEYANGEEPAEKPAVKVDPRTRVRRLVGLAGLALILLMAVIGFTPSLRNDLLPQFVRRAPAAEAPPPSAPDTMPAVQTYWEQLDLSSVSPEVIDQLILGKYYYDRRQPGNFGLAIDHWKKALALLGPKGNVVQKLLASAEKELAMQFSSDSADALVLLKQGKRDQAVALLEKMRADYLDVDSPQYTWASLVLHRRRR